MKQKGFRRFHKENGQSVVEAALVIPLIIVLLCGIIDFGWIFYNQLTLNHCSRQGARYAVVNSGDANLLSEVTSEVVAVSGFEDTGDLTVALQVVNGADIRVTVTKTVDILTPIAGVFTKDQQIVLTATCIMKIE